MLSWWTDTISAPWSRRSAKAARTKGRPTVLLAKTFKGRRISFIENHPDWHGKPLRRAKRPKGVGRIGASVETGSIQPQISLPNAAKAAPAKGNDGSGSV